MSTKKLRVAVIHGGRSGEHEISLRSAESILRELDRTRYDVVPLLIDKDGRWHPTPILPEPGANEFDVAFPILHGTFGEDGTVQGLLELAAIPYVGPGVLGSAVAMDKVATKRMLRAAALPVVECVVQYRGALDAAACEATLSYPMFVKPANLGSSVGISKAKNRDELQAALTTAAKYDSKVLIERGIAGREFECAVLGNEHRRASVPCEIRPKREFYDYEAKYIEDTTEIDLPANLTPEQTDEMQRLAVAACEALDLEGMTRVDFLMETATGQIFINEPNTIPGFTSISMYPKMWEHSGIPYSKLLDELIALALERAERQRATRYTK